eukprot:11177319-Prorocentrum_lima.AAC.1
MHLCKPTWGSHTCKGKCGDCAETPQAHFARVEATRFTYVQVRELWRQAVGGAEQPSGDSPAAGSAAAEEDLI